MIMTKIIIIRENIIEIESRDAHQTQSPHDLSRRVPRIPSKPPGRFFFWRRGEDTAPEVAPEEKQ